jgi:hypothetical protein
MKDEFYRPANIEFNVAHDGSNVPETFGEFKDAEEAMAFLGSNLIAVNSAITAARHMDFKEKTDLRNECTDIMENQVPVYEKGLSDAENALNDAKKKLKTAEEAYDFVISQAKSIANEVKRGLKDMELDELFTVRIAYKSRHYFFTYIDKQLKLCLIRDIPESEKAEIWNQMAGNEIFIDTNFGEKKTKSNK